MRRSPIRAFTLAVSMAAGCMLAWIAAHHMNHAEPIREGLKQLCQQSELEGADPERLQDNLDFLVDMYGLDAILSDPSSGRDFIRVGKKINELQMKEMGHLKTDQDPADLRSSSN